MNDREWVSFSLVVMAEQRHQQKIRKIISLISFVANPVLLDFHTDETIE
jgi:hypothetical protein